MALISIAELKSVLAIGSIYPDVEVQQVADAAQDIILSFLDFNRSAIVAVRLDENVATFSAGSPIDFVIGQSVTITGCGVPFNGAHVVTSLKSANLPVIINENTILVSNQAYVFTAAITNADISARPIKPSGQALLTSQIALYDDNPRVRTATMAIAVDVWETQKGTMGQQGVDFQPAPYRLGRSMLQRVIGLLGGNVDTNSMVG
jgi:hypothetical protein